MKVLIIDNHPAHRKLLRTALESEDIHVLEAGDSEAALALLENEMVDALVSDILIPDMDDYRHNHEALDDTQLCALPLIFYTIHTCTHASPDNQPFTTLVGANQYRTKPVSSETLVAALREITRRRKHGKSGSKSKPHLKADRRFLVNQYSPTLTNELPAKNLELEQIIDSLRAAQDEITKLNNQLDDCVRKHAEELTAINRQSLQRSEEANHFYKIVSHKLRTTLSSAEECFSAFRSGSLGTIDKTQIRNLSLARENSEHIHLCLNNILTCEQLAADALSLELKPCSLTEIVRHAITDFAPIATNKQIDLSYHIQSDLPEVRIDSDRITQVIGNLVSNALKFTSPGGHIHINVGESAKQKELLEVTVRDSGVGIAAEHLEHVFERLYQVKGAGTSVESGLGLGLYVCRHLIKKHGGNMIGMSDVGKGSTFSFVLPKKSGDSIESNAAESPALSNEIS